MNIKELLNKTIKSLGYDLVDFNISHTGLLRIVIDKDNGITIDDCVKVSNHLNKLLPVENIEYRSLEVSSPGVERPLNSLSDFRKFVGTCIKIKTKETVMDNKIFVGTLVAIDDNQITLKDNNQKLVIIDYENVYKAKTVFDFKNDFKKHNK